MACCRIVYADFYLLFVCYRTASGLRNAEMKWTNHDKLDAYGIRLEGWPANVPMLNPSHMSTTQNRAILEALESGQMKFVPIAVDDAALTNAADSSHNLTDGSHAKDDADIFEDTVDFSAYPETSEPTQGQCFTLDFRVASSDSAVRDTQSGASLSIGQSSRTVADIYAAINEDDIRSKDHNNHEHEFVSQSRLSHDSDRDANDATSAHKKRRVAEMDADMSGAEVKP